MSTQLPLEVLIEFREEEYDRLDVGERQRILEDHDYLSHEVMLYPEDWKERNKEFYIRHLGECVPCLRSAVVQRRQRIAGQHDVSSAIYSFEKQF